MDVLPDSILAGVRKLVEENLLVVAREGDFGRAILVVPVQPVVGPCVVLPEMFDVNG